MKKIRQKLVQIWIFTVYGIPEIWHHEVTIEKSRWLTIKCAWFAAEILSITGWSEKNDYPSS